VVVPHWQLLLVLATALQEMSVRLVEQGPLVGV
jgi:hypothetical protein